MRPVEPLRIGLECAETGVGAEVDRPSAELGAGEIARVGVVEDPPAKRDKVHGSDGEQPGLT